MGYSPVRQAVQKPERGVPVVDGVDLSQNPPVLKVGSRSFTLDKIKQVFRPGT